MHGDMRRRRGGCVHGDRRRRGVCMVIGGGGACAW